MRRSRVRKAVRVKAVRVEDGGLSRQRGPPGVGDSAPAMASQVLGLLRGKRPVRGLRQGTWRVITCHPCSWPACRLRAIVTHLTTSVKPALRPEIGDGTRQNNFLPSFRGLVGKPLVTVSPILSPILGSLGNSRLAIVDSSKGNRASKSKNAPAAAAPTLLRMPLPTCCPRAPSTRSRWTRSRQRKSGSTWTCRRRRNRSVVWRPCSGAKGL